MAASKAISLLGSDIDPKGYISPARAARFLDIKPQTVREWIRQGKLPAEKFAGTVRIKVEDFVRWKNLAWSPVKRRA